MSSFFLGVPFSDIENKVPRIDLITTREDESLAIAAGMVLAGGNPLVFMQDSGIGNSLDVITSLLIPYKIDVEILIGHRDTPEHHKIMGENSKKILKLVGYEQINYC